MIKRKSKFNYAILISVLAVLLVVSIVLIAASGAWFTAKKSGSSNITTATVSVRAEQNGSETKTSTNIIITQSSSTGVNLLQGSTAAAKAVTIKNTSTIPVYVRAYITCNWAANVAGYDDVYSVLNFTLGSNWVAPGAANNATNNQKIQSGMLYYSSALPVGETLYTLLSSVQTTAAMPSDAIINIFVEVVQADSIGQARFIESDPNISSWPL